MITESIYRSLNISPQLPQVVDPCDLWLQGYNLFERCVRCLLGDFTFRHKLSQATLQSYDVPDLDVSWPLNGNTTVSGDVKVLRSVKVTASCKFQID